MDFPELYDYIHQGLEEGKNQEELITFVSEYANLDREEARQFISKVRHSPKPENTGRSIQPRHLVGGMTIAGGLFVMVLLGFPTLQDSYFGLIRSNNCCFFLSGWFLVLIGAWFIISAK